MSNKQGEDKMGITRGSLIVLAAGIFLAACANNLASKEETMTPVKSEVAAVPTPRIPAHYNSADEAKPIGKVLDPATFKSPGIVKAYKYAQEIPEIFAQQPCFCYCDSGFGHKSLLSCFEGTHGAECGVCLQEGLIVKQLYDQGLSAAEIRGRIIQGDWSSIRVEY